MLGGGGGSAKSYSLQTSLYFVVRFGWVDVVVWVLTFSQNLVKFYHTLKKAYFLFCYTRNIIWIKRNILLKTNIRFQPNIRLLFGLKGIIYKGIWFLID